MPYRQWRTRHTSHPSALRLASEGISQKRPPKCSRRRCAASKPGHGCCLLCHEITVRACSARFPYRLSTTLHLKLRSARCWEREPETGVANPDLHRTCIPDDLKHILSTMSLGPCTRRIAIACSPASGLVIIGGTASKLHLTDYFYTFGHHRASQAHFVSNY